MSKATTAPKCVVCGSNHWLRDPHKWSDADTAHIRTGDIVATLKKKVATITNKPTNVATIPMSVATHDNIVATRRISIRELNNGISKHMNDLPFVVTRNGKDIARVVKV